MSTTRKLLILFFFIAALLVGVAAIWLALNFNKGDDNSGEDTEVTVLTCSQGIADEFLTDGDPDTSIWTKNVFGNNSIFVDGNRLNLDIPLQTGPQNTILSTNNQISGEFSAQLDIFDISSENGNGEVILSFTERTLMDLGVSVDNSTNELIIEGSVFGGDAIQDARVPLVIPEDGQPIITLKLDRFFRSDESGNQAMLVVMSYDTGNGFQELGRTQSLEIYSGDGDFSIIGAIPNFEDTQLSAIVDNFIVTCPVDSGSDDDNGGVSPTIEPTLTFGSEDVDIPNLTGAPTPTPTLTPTPIFSGGDSPSPTPGASPTSTPGSGNSVVINEESSFVCTAGVGVTATFVITVKNNEANTRTFNITDTLSSNVQDSYVITTSINMQGTYAHGILSWNNVAIPANSEVSLNYQLSIPEDKYGTYTDFVSVLEIAKNGQEVANSSNTFEVTCLPGTAIINDEVDRLILAFTLIISGFWIYKTGLYIQTGEYFWNKVGKKVLPQVTVGFEKQLKEEYEQDVQNKFEK